jgi:hypothetical protein
MEQSVELELKRLLTGLADQAILSQQDIVYEGSALHADEVCDLLFPSVMCMAQALSERLGTRSFGLTFEIVPSAVGFPLTMRAVDAFEQRTFSEIAPYVLEVFDGEVMECRGDIAHVYEAAARIVQPEFKLERENSFGVSA